MDIVTKQSTVEELANDISAAAEVLSTYPVIAEIQPPAFGPNSPEVVIPDTAPRNVLKARQVLIRAAAKIQQLVSEPVDYLPSLQIHYQYLACLRWLCQFNVLPCIPLEGSVPYSEVSNLANVPETQLRSICRMLMTSNFLCEPQADMLAHNGVSRVFITAAGYTDWASFITQLSMPAALRMADATEKWGLTNKKNETAANLAMGSELPVASFVQQSTEMMKSYVAHTRHTDSSDGVSVEHLVHGYDWAQLKDAVVVEVGISTESLPSAIPLAAAYPSLRFIVQDAADIINNISSVVQSQPESIRSRIAVHVHNGLSKQPVGEAQIYLLRMRLHDRPDTEALTIFQNHVDVLKHDDAARMIIVDNILPSLLPGEDEDAVRGHDLVEAFSRARSLTSMQLFNTRTRELSDVVDLLAKASDEQGKLVVKSMARPPGSILSILEVAYERFNS